MGGVFWLVQLILKHAPFLKNSGITGLFKGIAILKNGKFRSSGSQNSSRRKGVKRVPQVGWWTATCERSKSLSRTVPMKPFGTVSFHLHWLSIMASFIIRQREWREAILRSIRNPARRANDSVWIFLKRNISNCTNGLARKLIPSTEGWLRVIRRKISRMSYRLNGKNIYVQNFAIEIRNLWRIESCSFITFLQNTL